MSLMELWKFRKMELQKNNTIQLRLLEPDDLDWLFKLENDKRHWAVSGTDTPFSKKILKQYIACAKDDIYTAKQLRFVIEHHKKTVGLIDLFDFDPQHKKAGVGIIVEETYQTKGIASTALKLLISYAFEELKLHQLYANISKENLVSLKLFKKLQFNLVGTKKDWIFANDTHQDIVLFQLQNK